MTSGDEGILRVVSASLSLVRGSVMQELLAMREPVSAFNLAHGVRSAFLYASGWLFQWHEGPAAGVEKALGISQADTRLGRMRVLHRSLGPAALGETLQIVTTHGRDKPTDVARRLFRLNQSQALETPAQPDELWMQLLAPPGLASPARAESALVQRHVVAVTSGNSGAIDLVRAIGERAGVPVTYQRFASGMPKSADVGAAYADLPGPFHVMRLHALSRRSLSHPMVRLLLRDVQCVLLLLGDRAEANLALADDVAHLLAQLLVRPSLRLAAGSARTAREARQCLQSYSGDIADVDAAALWQAGPDGLFESLLGSGRMQKPADACLPA